MAANQTSFKKGQVTNPKGRTPLPEDVRLMLSERFLAGNPKAIDRLEKLIDSDDENVALKASLGWLAKTIKDGLVIEINGKDGSSIAEDVKGLTDRALEIALAYAKANEK